MTVSIAGGRKPQNPWLRCVGCGAETPLGAEFEGCSRCRRSGEPQPVEVVYDYPALAFPDFGAGANGQRGLWRFRALLPLPSGEDPVTLAEGDTPLAELPTPGPGRIWLKDETRNPTGTFKDRFHSVSVSMARHLGFSKVTAATTGNHGTSLAAYAARGERRCLVFCDPAASDLHRQLMQLFGARVVTLANRAQHLAWLVRERGWYPSTSASPLPVSTPYGVEGYKTIAYEVVHQLGRVPALVFAPVAGGDSLYGVWKGFWELQRLGVAAAVPRMIAVQSSGCDPLVEAFRRGERRVGVHPSPHTIATSIGDETGGPLALKAVYDSGGSAIAVSDADIIDAVRRLAATGIAVEPASAASFAAALAAQSAGGLGEDQDAVCLLTGALARWPDALKQVTERHECRDESPAGCRAWIAAFDAAG